MLWFCHGGRGYISALCGCHFQARPAAVKSSEARCWFLPSLLRTLLSPRTPHGYTVALGGSTADHAHIMSLILYDRSVDWHAPMLYFCITQLDNCGRCWVQWGPRWWDRDSESVVPLSPHSHTPLVKCVKNYGQLLKDQARDFKHSPCIDHKECEMKDPLSLWKMPSLAPSIINWPRTSCPPNAQFPVLPANRSKRPQLFPIISEFRITWQCV